MILVFFTLPFDETVPKYNAKALSEYCKMHNKMPNELTDQELKQLNTNIIGDEEE